MPADSPAVPGRPFGAPSPAAAPARARRSRWAHLLTHNAGLVLAVVMLTAAVVLYAAIYLAAQHRLPGGFELISAVNSTMPLAFASVAQTVVVLTRGIDLSVGGVIDISNALAALTLGKSAASQIGWSLVILGVGAACGLLNGLLVTIGRLQPILVTLATLSIYQGIAIRILPQPGGQVPDSYTAVLSNTDAPTSLGFLVLVALFWSALRRTRFGVGIYAIGNDAAASQAHGVPVRRTRIGAYVLGGTFSAAAGLFLAASATAGDATTGNTYTLTSIVAAVLGGVSLFGGRGSAVGAVVGAFISTLIVDILFFSHIDPLYQSFYEGLFLVVAVVLVGGVGALVRARS